MSNLLFLAFKRMQSTTDYNISFGKISSGNLLYHFFTFLKSNRWGYQQFLFFSIRDMNNLARAPEVRRL